MTSKILLEKKEAVVSNPTAPLLSPWSKVAKTAMQQLAQNREIKPIEPPPLPDFEEISKYSILDMKPDFEAAPSPKLFALMFADPIALSSRWEGGNPYQNLDYLKKYLDFYVSKKKIDKPTRLKILKIIYLLELTSCTGKDPTEIMKTIAELKTGESYLMVGGYGGKPGHALLYKFTKRPDGNFDLYIYNSGEGLNFHFEKDVEHRERYQPVEVIENIPPEALCLSSNPAKCKPDVIARLVELSNWNDQTTPIQSSDIYRNIFGHLYAKRRTVMRSDGDLSGSMRAGSCSWKVFWSSFLRYELGDIAEFKGMSVTGKYDVTRAFYHSVKSWIHEDSQNADELRVILRNAVNSQLHSLAKQKGAHLEQYCTLSDLKMRIDEIESNVRLQRLNKTRKVNWTPPETPQDHSDLLQKTTRSLKRPTVNAVKVYTKCPQLPTAFSANNFDAALKTICRELEDQNTLATSKQALIESTADLLPDMDDAFWNEIPKSDLKSSAESLFILLTNYHKYVSKPHAIHAQHQNCALALYAGLHKLSLRLSNGGELGSYGIYVESFSEQLENARYFLFYEPKAFNRQMKLLNYFKTQGKNKGLIFNFKNYDQITEDNLVNIPEIKLLSNLAKSETSTHSRLKKKVNDNSERFEKASHEEVTAGTLLSYPELFSNSPHEYISLLMKGAIALQLFAGYHSSGNDTEEISISLNKPYWSTGLKITHICGYSLEFDKHKTSKRAKVLHREKEKENLKDIVESRYFSRADSKITEANTLINFTKSGKIEWDKLLACVNCEPALQPAKVLHYFRDHLNELKEPDSQTLFDLLFYKPYFKEGSWSVPLFNELDSTSLIKQIDDFIKQGLNIYYEKQPGSKPDVYACLFFIRLICRVKAAKPSAALPDALALLNLWLQDPSLKPEQLSALHLHRAFAYLTRPDKNYTKQELLEILESWLYFCQQPLDPNWNEPDLEEKVRRFIHDLAPQFNKLLADAEDASLFFNQLMQKCGIEDLTQNRSKLWKEAGFPKFSIYFSSNSYWEINILNGMIASETGIVRLGSTANFVNDSDYKRLFGENRFPVRQSGQYVHFIHPRWGSIRLDTSNYIRLTIYRSIGEGRWTQFISPRYVKDWQQSVPLSYLADQTHWMSLDDPTAIEVLPLREGSKKSGRIVEDYIFQHSHDKTHTISPVLHTAFDHFEEKSAIHYQSAGERDSVHLFRYRSFNGKTLHFFEQDKALHFAENPKFILPEDQRLGLLGPNPNYLYIKDPESGAEKILVPMQPVHPSYDGAITRWQRLDTKDTHRQEEYQKSLYGKIGQKQKGVYRFFEFDLVQNGARDVVTASNQEGTLYLAYLYFIQRDYLKALQHLREISEAEALSPLSLKILFWLFEAGEQYADKTASNAAIKLHAYLLLEKIKKRPDMHCKFSGEEEKMVSNWKNGWAKRYRDALGTIPLSLQLSKEGEAAFKIKRQLTDSSKGQSYANELEISPFKSLIHPSNDTVKTAEKPAFVSHEDPDFYFYRCKLNDYQNAVEKYAVIKCADKPNRDPKGTPSSEFGHFYRRAKKVKDSSEALSFAVEFELFLKKLHSENKNKRNDDVNDLAKALIHLALLYPDKAPDVPLDIDSNNEEKFKWFKRVYDAWEQARFSTHRFANSPNLLKADKQKAETIPSTRDFTPIFKLAENFQKRADTKPTAPELLEGPLSQQFSFFSYTTEFFDFTTPHTSDLKIDPTSIDIKEEDLPESERPYLNAIRQEVKDFFENELPKGIEENKERKDYSLKTTSSLSVLKDRLVKGDGEFLGIEKSKEQLSRLREIILKLANKPPQDSQERFLQRILESGEALDSSELEELINCWMRKNPSQFQALNPKLTREECQQLDQLITLYLEYATALQQAKRAFVLVEKLEKEPTEETENELAATLEAGWTFDKDTSKLVPIFDPQKERILRIIEYRANIRLRKQQVDLIQNMRKMEPTDNRFKHSIAQMMMGGGKTSVVAAVLLIDLIMQQEEADRPLETVPVFIGPTAQFETLKRNLSISQRSYFGQKVVPIALVRNEMTASNLKWVLDQLSDKKSGSAILLRPDTAPGLELEGLSLLHKIKNAEKNANTSSLWERVFLIIDILTIVGYDTASLLDELDVLLDPRVEMNFPDDPPDNIGVHYVELLRRLFRLMTDENLQTKDGKSIAKLLDLRNPDRNFDESLFYDKILPVIALQFAKYPDFLLKETQHKSFVRYVCGQMDPKKLTQEDAEFLEMLKNRAKSSDEDARLSVDLIATAKYTCRKITKSTMNGDVGKNFGRNITKSDHPDAPDDQMSVKVVYFEGTDSPTHNIPGNFFESIFYHFLTALCVAKEGNLKNVGIHEEQVREFARQLRLSAEYYVDKYDEIFDETPEAKECLEITGIKLSQILDEDNLKKATRTINSDIDKILLVEAETIKNEVQYFPHYFGSNSQNFVDLLSRRKGRGGSVRTMSGTPWNLPSYARRLFENFLPDVGVEGQIAHVELSRAATNPHWLHETSDTSVKGVLDAALKDNPRANEVRAIADSAYFFKKSDNLTVALEIQHYFKDRKDIETVLFFGRKKTDNPNEPKGRPDFLYMLKKDSKKPIYIGSTAKSELAKHNINPETCFVYYDDRHCEATDIPLKKTGIVIKTNNKKEIRRTRHQTNLRARGFFGKQIVETVIKKDERAAFIHGGKIPLDFLLTSIKNQAIRKTDDAYSSLRKAIAGVARSFVSQKIKALRNDKKALLEYFSAYEEILRTTTQVKPWEQFGQLEESTSAKAALEQYAKHHINAFKKLNLDPKEQLEIETQINEIVEEGSSSAYFPKEIITSLSDQMETEQQVEFHQQVHVEVAKEVEIELERELQQELQKYLELRANDPAKEFDWTDQDVLKFPFHDLLRPLETHMKECKHYVKPYHQIFNGCLVASSNFARSTNINLPVFHASQKPAHQILVMRTKQGPKLVLLSIHEADFFKDYLQRKKPTNMWLILSSGLEISSHPHDLLEKEEQKTVDRGMLQVHFLNGNIHALDKNEDAAVAFMSEKDSDLKMRFLKLRVEKDKTQRRILYRSALLPTNEKAKSHLVTHSFRKDYETARKQDFSTLTPSKIAVMKPNDVIYLSSHQIQHLTTREQLQKLKPAMVKHVTLEQVPLLPPTLLTELTTAEQINCVDPTHYSLLTASQLQKLSAKKVPLVPDDRVKDLSFEQVPFVPNANLKSLSMPQVQAVTATQVPHLENEQFKHLVTREQVQEVPLDKVGCIDPKHVPLLNEKQLDALPLPLLPSLLDDQLKLLKKQEQVQAIDVKRVQFLSNLVVGLLKDQQLPGIVETQAPGLTTPQVKLLTRDQIPWVEAKQVADVLDKMLIFLNKKGQIQAVEPSRIALIAPAMAEHLGEKQIPSATKEQVPHLKGEQLKYIVETQLPDVTTSQVPNIDNQFVPKLTDKQVAGVAPSQVPYLKDEQLKLLSTADLIQAIPVDKIHLATEKQVPFLNAHQLKAILVTQLPYVQKSQVPHIKDAFVRNLSQQQVSGVSPLQVPLLDDPQLKWLDTPAQIQAIALEKVPLVTKEQVPHLNAKQLQSITETQLPDVQRAQVRHLKKEFIPKLSKEQVPGVTPEQTLSLTDEQLVWLMNPEHIKVLPKEKIPLVSNDAVKHLAPEQISHATKDQVPFLEGKQLESIVSSQLPHLKLEQVAHISEKLLPDLSDDQVPGVSAFHTWYLKPSQVKLLVKKEQIEALRNDFVPLISDGMVKHLTAKQIPHVKLEQVRLLDKTQLASIVENQLVSLDPSQVPHIKDEFVPKLGAQQVPGVAASQTSLLKNEQLKWLTTSDQVKAVENSKVPFIANGAVKHLATWQVPHASNLQVPSLEDGQIAHITAAQVPNVKTTQVHLIKNELAAYFHDNQVPFATPEQVPHLKDEQLKLLEAGKQIRAVLQGKIHLLLQKHLSDLDDNQFEWISKEQIEQLSDPLFEKLSAYQIPDVPVPLLSKLSVEQHKHLSERQVAAIDPNLVPSLPDEKIPALKSAQQLEKLEPSRVALLTRTQLKVLYPTLLSRIALILTGLFYWMARLVTLMTGLALMAKCMNCIKRPVDHINTGSGRFWIGLKTLC